MDGDDHLSALVRRMDRPHLRRKPVRILRGQELRGPDRGQAGFLSGDAVAATDGPDKKAGTSCNLFTVSGRLRTKRIFPKHITVIRDRSTWGADADLGSPGAAQAV